MADYADNDEAYRDSSSYVNLWQSLAKNPTKVVVVRYFSVLRLILCGFGYIQSCHYMYHVRFMWVCNCGLFPLHTTTTTSV